jgi:hypothetical protein
VPDKFVAVTTFEVKEDTNLKVTAVYEDLAHLRVATRAYVLAVVPSAKREALKKIEDIATEASRHSVGSF